MLNILRQKGVSKKILWVIAVIIILSFGVFGTASRLDHTVNSAGRVNGQNVSLKEFEKAYLDSRDQALLMYGDRFFKVGNMINMENEAWDQIILLREAKKHHIKVSDQEVVEFIGAMPFFQRDGKFDHILYQDIVHNPSVFDRDPHDFEEGMRGHLIIKKLLDQAAGPIVITDEELKKEYVRRNEKITLSYALFTPTDYSKDVPVVTPEEIRKFYDEHKENFRHPAMVNVQYVQMTYPAKATDEQKEKIKKDAQAMAKELTPSADFAAIAQKHNAVAQDSGFFTQEQPLLTFAWSPEWVEKIFTMKPGAVGAPMESPDGWQIIKLKERKESSIPAFESIQDKAQQALINQKAYAVAQSKAEGTLKTIQDALTAKDKNFKTVSDGLGLKIQQTAPFARGEYISAPGLTAEFQQASLNLNLDHKLSEIVPTSQGPAILCLDNIETIDAAKFKEDQEEFRQMMTAQKRNQTITAFVTKLKLEANVQSSLKDKIRYR